MTWSLWRMWCGRFVGARHLWRMKIASTEQTLKTSWFATTLAGRMNRGFV
jgi:hypothetical protein